jgi:hypothetical protein
MVVAGCRRRALLSSGCAGVRELYVTSFTVSTQPSLSPDGPVTQQQQLAAVEAQLPALSCQPPHSQHSTSRYQHSQHTSNPAAVALFSCSAGLQATHAGGLWDPSTQHEPQLLIQHLPRSSYTTSTNSGTTGQHDSNMSSQPVSGVAGGVDSVRAVSASGAERDVHGVVFLSNTMGSLQYVVTHDSAVYLKRGALPERVTAALWQLAACIRAAWRVTSS